MSTVKLLLACEPEPVAAAAEVLRHGGDEANLALHLIVKINKIGILSLSLKSELYLSSSMLCTRIKSGFKGVCGSRSERMKSLLCNLIFII
jgi:hypothetical protein